MKQDGHTAEKVKQEGHTGEKDGTGGDTGEKGGTRRTHRCTGGLRLFASFLIDALSLSDWFPVVPVEDGAGQSATSLAGRIIWFN